VWWVADFLKTRPEEQLSDSAIKANLNAALLRNSLLDNAAIDVAVNNRIADLSGRVSSDFQSAEAQDAASLTQGVVLVRNHLKVEPEVSAFPDDYLLDAPYYPAPSAVSGIFRPQPYLSDGRVKKIIEDRLFWSPYVEMSEIKIVVDKGVATVTGAVATRLGLTDVDRAVRNSGAIKVVDRVMIKNGP
ncbi:MAG: BON domain-containing protein, partial [Chitinivibrionales bacterium]|nr:BON domain-containing protein [Chitinivibrionales bacterium]